METRHDGRVTLEIAGVSSHIIDWNKEGSNNNAAKIILSAIIAVLSSFWGLI